MAMVLVYCTGDSLGKQMTYDIEALLPLSYDLCLARTCYANGIIIHKDILLPVLWIRIRIDPH
jgi:hypothetical protein